MQLSRANRTLVTLATVTIVIAALYLGKPVFMPLAVATLLAFLLSPVVNAVARLGVYQPIAVTLVVFLMFSLLTGVVWGFGVQLRSLANELPDYKQNLREKIADLRSASKGPTVERIRQTWRELRGELHKPQAATTNGTVQATATNTNTPADRDPVPVVVQGQAAPSIWSIPTALGPLMEVLATTGLILVLVIFMLLRKRELRNRLILLFGYGQLPTTTRALDEAAERISRYLLMQTVVNSAYGFAVGVSLYLVGVPYALLWGFLAALLRFIPYVGAWLGAAMPVLLSLAVFPGWLHAFLVFGLILMFELINNMFMEPLLYGQSAGVSDVALVVAVAFWTWVWGPIGLALATPLTVCLVVLGKYVPGLSFLALLLGDGTVMEPPTEFYQRLLAMDEVEAEDIVVTYRKGHDLISVYDELFVPALISARRDYREEKLSTDHLDFIINTTGQLISKLGHGGRSQSDQEPREEHEVFGVPVQDTIDELVMAMLGHVLPAHIQLRNVSAESLSGEIVEQLQNRQARAICVGSVVPGGVKETRYMVKRLQAAFPNIPLVVARWGSQNERSERDVARPTDLLAVATTLKTARNLLMQYVQLTPEPLPLQFSRREVELAPTQSN